MPLRNDVPPISGLTLRIFRRVVRRYFRRHFRGVHAQDANRLLEVSGPLIVYGNHSSWWDPMLIVLLGDLLLPHRKHYAPIDSRALEQYPVLRKLGIFPVEMGSPRGAAQFLRTAEAVLRSGGVLWLTPQGRFADPRDLPLSFRPGLGALALRMPGVPLLPLAVEYTFWDERLPEALLHFGERMQIAPKANKAAATRELEDALARAMFALQQAAVARNPVAFKTLFTGARGSGGVYAMFRRVEGLFRRRPVGLDHTVRDEG